MEGLSKMEIPPCLSVVGKSDSGKTTLLEKLIPALKARGLKVGVVKHDVHGFEMDKPGKDTYRQFHSGADMVLIASKDKIGMQKRLAEPLSLPEICERYFSDMDLILTEGYKSGPMPKIEVFRPEIHKHPLCGPGDRCIGMVTDAELSTSLPCFGWSEVERLCDFIIQTLKVG